MRLRDLPLLLASIVAAVGRADAAPPGDGWYLIHADEFSGASLDPVKWDSQYQWGRTHNHDAYMLDENVVVSRGLVSLMATRDSANGMPYRSGVISSHNDFRYTYGYAEMRIKMPTRRGSWPAFWMLDAGWPPEIDVMEYPLFASGDRAGIADEYYVNSHWSTGSGNASNGQWVDRNVNLGAEFHTYGLEWTSTNLRYYFDGVLVKAASNQATFQNMYTIFNYAVGGWPGSPSTSQWPVGASDAVQADYFRVWQRPASVPDTAWSYSAGTSSAWDVDANWSNSRARFERQRAYFDTQTGRRSMQVTWSGSRTLGELHIAGSTAYTLGDSGGVLESLMFADAPDGWARLAVDSGNASHTINSRLDVWTNLEIVHHGGSPLRLNGGIVGQARQDGAGMTGGIVQFRGPGQVIVTGGSAYQRDTRLDEAANVQLLGSLYQEPTAHSSAIVQISGSSRLELANLLESGAAGASLGHLRNGAAAIVVNDGAIVLNQPSQSSRGITIAAGGATIEANAEVAWLDAEGQELVSSSGGSVTLAGAGNAVLDKALNGSGGVTKRGAGKWELRSANAYAGSTQILEGALSITGATGAGAVFVAAGATLGGTGTIAGPLTVNGILAPGIGAGAGELQVGAATLATGSTWHVELISADSFDQLTASSSLIVEAGAAIAISIPQDSNFTPTAGAMYAIATATGGISGVFDRVSVPDVPGLAWSVLYAVNSIVLQLVPASNSDFNGDGLVDGADLLAWQLGFGAAGEAQRSDGDANGDGTVDASDLIAWQLQYGLSAVSRATFATPEPVFRLLLPSMLSGLTLARFRLRGQLTDRRGRPRSFFDHPTGASGAYCS